MYLYSAVTFNSKLVYYVLKSFLSAFYNQKQNAPVELLNDSRQISLVSTNHNNFRGVIFAGIALNLENDGQLLQVSIRVHPYHRSNRRQKSFNVYVYSIE